MKSEKKHTASPKPIEGRVSKHAKTQEQAKKLVPTKRKTRVVARNLKK